MIFKQFQLNKSNLNQYNYFLLYGKNEGLQNEIIEKYFTSNSDGEICKYEESEFLKNYEIIISELLNMSLFSKKKILIVSRASDKLTNTIDNILSKNLNDIKIIFKSSVLEKKSKLRNLFEKSKFLVTIPFYEDDISSLLAIINHFLSDNKITMSREGINLLIERASGDRKNLKKELEKIYSYSLSNKNLKFDVIRKLTNLAENQNVNELAEQYLSKNTKKVAKILNENVYSDEDCLLILRTILGKSKRLLLIIKKNREVKDIDKVIMATRPPIFWKEKENVKKQATYWDFDNLKDKIYQINKIETLIKTNSKNSLNIVSDFIVNY